MEKDKVVVVLDFTKKFNDKKRYEVHFYVWGSVIYDKFADKWIHAVLKNGDEINLVNLSVIIHPNGIEFT